MTVEPSPPVFNYSGTELEVFGKAENWKAYWTGMVRSFLGNDVLEVGAGFGETTKFLIENPAIKHWVCVEPDPVLCQRLKNRINVDLPEKCSVVPGTLGDLRPEDLFDSVLYIDVLEHIERDAEELAQATAHLRIGGHLIVLAPAHQFLYTAFDQAIGHFRRYDKSSLVDAASQTGLQLVKVCYLDSVGLLASLANRILLRSATPSAKQILFWDSVLVRASRIVDPLLRRTIGKSVLGIWQKSTALPKLGALE